MLSIRFFMVEKHEIGSSRPNPGTRVSYNSYFDEKRGTPPRQARARTRRRDFDLDNIYFKRMTEADDVLTAMGDLVEDYGEVTVADFFDLAGVDGAKWTHNKWGWKDLSRSYSTHTRNGYTIVLPEPEELD